jgi:hypothetical protein
LLTTLFVAQIPKKSPKVLFRVNHSDEYPENNEIVECMQKFVRDARQLRNYTGKFKWPGMTFYGLEINSHKKLDWINKINEFFDVKLVYGLNGHIPKGDLLRGVVSDGDAQGYTYMLENGELCKTEKRVSECKIKSLIDENKEMAASDD